MAVTGNPVGNQAPLSRSAGRTPVAMQHLSNGLTTVVLPAPRAHQVLVNLLIPLGSRYETPANSGITHFLEHMLFRGNRLHPHSEALNRAFEEAGGMLNAHTGVETLDFDMVAHPSRIDAAVEALAHLVREPTFPDLDKERRVLLDELYYDYNEQGALVNAGALSSAMLWPDHPLGQMVGGVPDTISAMGVQPLQAYHRSSVVPQRAVLALAGRITPEAGQALAERWFGDWRSGAPAASQSAPLAAPPPRGGGPHLLTVRDSDNQFHVQLSFPAPGYNDADEPAMSLLSRTLDDGPTSVLQRHIREDLALVYHIGAGYSAYWDAGQFDIATSVHAERLLPLMEALLNLLSDFRRRGPDEDDVERARMRDLFDLDYERDSLGARVERHAWPLLYSTVRSISEDRAIVRRISRKRLAALAERVLAPEHLNLVVVGPLAADTESQLRRLLAAY